MNQQDHPDFFLTKREIEGEARRQLQLYRKARKGKPGPEPNWKMFIMAGYLSLKKKQGRGTRLTKADANILRDNFKFDLNPNRDELDPKKINRWIHGPAYRSTMEREEKEFTQWLGGPFRRAVSMIHAGLEGEPAPTRRDLLRYFRPPGNKNCSTEELARFQGMIDRMAADLAAWRPNPNDPNLDPAHNLIIPRLAHAPTRARRVIEWKRESNQNK